MTQTARNILQLVKTSLNEQNFSELIATYLHPTTTEAERETMRPTLKNNIQSYCELIASKASQNPKQYLQAMLVYEGFFNEELDQRDEILKWERHGRFADEHGIDYPELVEAATRAAPPQNRSNFPNPDNLRKRAPQIANENKIIEAVQRIRAHTHDWNAVLELIQMYETMSDKHRDAMREKIRFHSDVIHALLEWDAPQWDMSTRIRLRLAAVMLTDGYPNPYVALDHVRYTYQLAENMGGKPAYAQLFHGAALHASPRGKHLLKLPPRLDMSLWVGTDEA